MHNIIMYISHSDRSTALCLLLQDLNYLDTRDLVFIKLLAL